MLPVPPRPVVYVADLIVGVTSEAESELDTFAVPTLPAPPRPTWLRTAAALTLSGVLVVALLG